MGKAWFMAAMDKELQPQWNIPSCFIAPMEKAWFMAAMDKELWPQWNMPSCFIAPMEKAWFYEIIVMINDKKDAL